VETDAINKEYIDVDDALRRVGGNMGLYKRLLGRFLEGRNIEALEDALTKDDMEEAAHHAHTLKGVAANLSLTGVRSISVDLEQAIKNGSDYSGYLTELKQVYSTTAEIITEMMKTD